MTNPATTRYYTADNPATGLPSAVWRDLDAGGTEVFDPATNTWVPAGWPAKHLAGHDLNYTDVDPADVPALIARLGPAD